MTRIDPRLLAAKERLSKIKVIVPVMSSKGGVGKTVIAGSLAVLLARSGIETGLLDLDFTNPGLHVLLGADISLWPEEEKGVVPPRIAGVRFMTTAYYSGDEPLPLRGKYVDEVFKEILCITRWPGVEVLIIDTPPGIRDEALDILTYIPTPRPLIVGTPSPLAIKSVEKLIKVLREVGHEIIGLIENMASGQGPLKQLAEKYGVEYLGNIPYISNIDQLIGNPHELVNKIEPYLRVAMDRIRSFIH